MTFITKCGVAVILGTVNCVVTGPPCALGIFQAVFVNKEG
jgi:hypothetical protein